VQFQFWCKTKIFFWRNPVHQLFVAWKFVKFFSLIIAVALILIKFLSQCNRWPSIHIAHLFLSIHVSFLTYIVKLCTSFRFTQNSQLVAQLFKSSTQLTTCSIKFALYFKHLDDIFLLNRWNKVSFEKVIAKKWLILSRERPLTQWLHPSIVNLLVNWCAVFNLVII